MAARLLPALEKTLERRLKVEQAGEVRFDAFTRGRYATDASHYQIMPLGVVTPQSMADAEQALAICRSAGVAVTPRGGGTSQAGQTVNRSVILDCARHLNRIIEVDAENRRCLVEPGIVLDELNRALRTHGLWFPVDISTASRATIGGMVGNNSCGARSLRYGNTRENVLSIDAVLADGTRAHFMRFLETEFPSWVPRYEKLYEKKYAPQDYRKQVQGMIRLLQERYGLPARGEPHLKSEVRSEAEQVGFAW